MRCNLLVLLIIAALIGTIGGAMSAEQRATPLPVHFRPATDACFGKTYDAAHLAQHPQQRVTSIHISRDFSPDPNAEAVTFSREELLDHDREGHLNVTALVRVRDRQAVYSNWLSCRKNDKGGVRCGVECDGGGFDLKPAGTGLVLENEGFVAAGGCGASDDERDQSLFVASGTDDKVFEIEKQDMAQCAALRDAQKPNWAKLGAPIRERLASRGALCLSRAYDKAHLAGHSQQTIARIAVLKKAGTKPDSEEVPSYDLTFRIELKNGRKIEKVTNCWPDKYAYVCTHNKAFDSSQDFYLTRAGADVTLRDRRGRLAALFGTKLGADDRLFRLEPSPTSACAF